MYAIVEAPKSHTVQTAPAGVELGESLVQVPLSKQGDLFSDAIVAIKKAIKRDRDHKLLIEEQRFPLTPGRGGRRSTVRSTRNRKPHERILIPVAPVIEGVFPANHPLVRPSGRLRS